MEGGGNGLMYLDIEVEVPSREEKISIMLHLYFILSKWLKPKTE